MFYFWMIDNMILKHTLSIWFAKVSVWLVLKCMGQWLFSLLWPNTSLKHLMQTGVYFASWFLALSIHHAGQGLLICSCHRELAMWLVHILMDHSKQMGQKSKNISHSRLTHSHSLLLGTHHSKDTALSQNSTTRWELCAKSWACRGVSCLNINSELKYLKKTTFKRIALKHNSSHTLQKHSITQKFQILGEVILARLLKQC